MKRVVSLAFLIFLSTSLSATAEEFVFAGVSPTNAPGFIGYASDRIVVQFSPTVMHAIERGSMARGRVGIPALDSLGMRHDVNAVSPLFPGSKKKSYRGRTIDLSGWHRVHFRGSVDVLNAAAEYRRTGGVIDAQPVSIHAVSRTPNDTWYAPPTYQGHLPRILAPEAWDIQTGDPSVIVAVLDTGVRYFHPDLGGSNASYYNPGGAEGNMWINQAEKNGEPNVDDDGNGYPDDWIGYDFVASTDIPGVPCMTAPWWPPPGSSYEREDCGTPDNDPRDFHGHGTHVSGIVGALNNNFYGVAAPAGGWGDGTLAPWGNGVRIMPLRIGWSALLYGILEVGVVAMDSAAEALYYAANNGAKIASCSWESENTGGLGVAVDDFLARGGLIFKAAGNSGTETFDYLSGREDVINVAATDLNDCKATFSNFGSWVDIAAPGVDILSLFHNHLDPANEYVTRMSGTSMSTPLAASVAALIWSKNPGLSAGQVRQTLQGTADPIDGIVTPSCSNIPYAGKLGAGRINAYEAVIAAGSPVAPVADFTGSPTSGIAPLTVDFIDSSTGIVYSRFWTFGDGGSSSEQNPSHTYTVPGTYNISLTVTGPGEPDTETKADYITVHAPSLPLVGVSALATGKYVTSGRGKTRGTVFSPTNSFSRGDEVVIRATVTGSGVPLSGAVVEIDIFGPGDASTLVTALTSGRSGIDGIAEARWQTSAPKGNKNTGGTQAGLYTAAVRNVTADGHDFDNNPTASTFTIP